MWKNASRRIDGVEVATSTGADAHNAPSLAAFARSAGADTPGWRPDCLCVLTTSKGHTVSQAKFEHVAPYTNGESPR